MTKKIFALLLCLALLPVFTIVASAANKQITYGSSGISGEILTDFTDGQICGQASGSGSMSISGGVLTMQAAKGSYVESYTYYRGGNIGSQNVRNAKYICFELENANNGAVLFNFQGTREDGSANGRNFRTSHAVEDRDDLFLILVNEEGKAYYAEMESSNLRLAVKLPAGFKGSLLIPTSCVTNATANDPDWANGGNLPFRSLGFYIFDKGEGGSTATVKIKSMFMLANELPQTNITDYPTAPAAGITNPEYSYTNAQRIQGYWTENVMRNECITFVQDANGKISAHTLFTPKRIITIIDNAHKKEFKAGVDFEWVQGTNEIRWLTGSSIPYFFDGALKGLKEEGGTEYVKNWDGSFDSTGRALMGGWLYCVGAFLYEKQLSITYEYDQKDTSQVTHATYQADSFKNVAKKIQNGETLNIVFYGASNFEGCDASGMYNRAPNMPVLHKLVEGYLKDNGIKAKVTNIGVGGWNSAQGLAALKGQTTYTLNGVTNTLVKPGNGQSVGQTHKNAIKDGVDLFIMGYFAGNNIGSGITAAQYKQFMKEAMQEVLSYNPDCEFVMLSGSINNNITVAQADSFREKIKELQSEYKSCAGISDLIQVYKDMMARKEYIALSGNNINHPNDWFVRVTAMEILSCFVPGYDGNPVDVDPTPSGTVTNKPTATPTNKPTATPTNKPTAPTVTDIPSASTAPTVTDTPDVTTEPSETPGVTAEPWETNVPGQTEGTTAAPSQSTEATQNAQDPTQEPTQEASESADPGKDDTAGNDNTLLIVAVAASVIAIAAIAVAIILFIKMKK